MTPILICALIVLVCSFVASLLESSLYSLPPGRVRRLVAERRRGADRLARMHQHQDEAISAILAFNTLVNITGAMLLGTLLSDWFETGWAVVIGAAAFGVLVLLVAEIIPKTFGVLFNERVALTGAIVVEALMIGLAPIVRPSRAIAQAIRRRSATRATVTEEDLIATAEIAAEESSILPQEARWVTNSLRLKHKLARDLMTPRIVVYRLPKVMPLSMVEAHSDHWKHSRLPLCENHDPDRIVGVVYRREIFDALVRTPEEELPRTTLEKFAHPVEFIPESLPGNQLLERFLKTRMHLFVVINEHGVMEGVVTLEDVIEELIGAEIVDMHDQHRDMQEYARSMAKARSSGMTPRRATN